MTLKHSETGKCLPLQLRVGMNVCLWHDYSLMPTCGQNRNEKTFVILFLATLEVVGGIVCLTKLAVNRTAGVLHLLYGFQVGHPRLCCFCCVIFEAGEVFGIFILAKFGIVFLRRYFLLKYTRESQIKTLKVR